MAFLDDLLRTLTTPRSLIGGGLLLGGSLLDREPGEALEAKQALRNQFNATPSALIPPFSQPGLNFLTQQVTGPSDPFAPGGVYESYLPVLHRQEQDLLSGLSNRYAAAFPANVGIQGPEVKALRRATGELAENRQALIANLLREQQTRQAQSAGALLDYGRFFPELQQNAASRLLQYSRPDPTASALANLGTIIAMSQLFGGQGGFGGVTGGGGLDALRRSLGLGGGGGGGGGIQGLLNSLGLGGAEAGTGAGGVLSGLGSGLGSLLSSQIPGLGISLGTLLGTLGAGTVGTLGGGALGRGIFGETDESRGTSRIGGGLGSVLGAILGSLVAPGFGTVLGAGLGGGAGGLAGAGIEQPDISRRETFQGALGSALLGPLGAFFAGQGNQSTGKNIRDALLTGLGGLLGGVGGSAVVGGILGKQRGAAIEKAQFRSQDVDSQRDQVYEIGNVGASLLQQAGVGQPVMDAWRSYVEGRAATSDSPADEQGEVSAELNRLLTSNGFPPDQRPAAWRQEWIDYLIANTFSAGDSSYGGGAPLNLISGPGSWLNLAQLARGGRARQPLLAVVGEEGPELAYLQPGSSVLPLLN